MKIRTFLWIFLMIPFSICARETLRLENDQVKAEFDSKTGSLTKLVYKATGWNIVDRTFLGQSFEMLMPIANIDIRFNVIKGINQKAPVVEQQPDRITFIWSGMRSELMEADADITFKGVVRLTDTGLEYSGEVTNNSPYSVEYVSWPFFGEMSIPDKNQPLYHSTSTNQRELFPHFYNEHGYWGVDYPTSTYPIPEHSFVLVHNNDQGFIIHRSEILPSDFHIISFELIPGFELRNTNPQTDTMDGQPVRIQMKSNRVIYNQPGERTNLKPIQLSLYKGTWHTALDIYNKEKETPKLDSPEWFGQPLTWLNVKVANGSELIASAKEAMDFGVQVLQVKEWYSESNGQLNEIQGLSEAIEQCHGMNMRVILETNWTRINKHSRRYKDEFHKYVISDPWGISYNDSYLCPLAGIVQQRVMEEWSKLPSLKVADGVVNTDNNNRDKSYFCFSHNHDHRVGEPTANGAMQLNGAMAELIRKNGTKDKVIMGLGFADGQNIIYNGYQVQASPQHYAKQRYMNPSVPVLSIVDERNARRDINMALLNRFNMMYNLQFHDNRLENYPRIVSYVREVESFRKRYNDYIWNADHIAPTGISVEGNNLYHSVLRNRKTGRKAIVVVNMGTESSSAVKVRTDALHNFGYASPDDPEMKPYEDIKIHPQSVVVFFEQ